MGSWMISVVEGVAGIKDLQLYFFLFPLYLFIPNFEEITPIRNAVFIFLGGNAWNGALQQMALCPD